uniref:Gustatory receptor n=1 Tax=Propsilocerus akamusi TaxID=903466 RepID=A0A7D0TCS2_9DIPT|nr:gustatory receptor 26 [Propsilocerus akamusi]
MQLRFFYHVFGISYHGIVQKGIRLTLFAAYLSVFISVEISGHFRIRKTMNLGFSSDNFNTKLVIFAIISSGMTTMCNAYATATAECEIYNRLIKFREYCSTNFSQNVEKNYLRRIFLSVTLLLLFSLFITSILCDPLNVQWIIIWAPIGIAKICSIHFIDLLDNLQLSFKTLNVLIKKILHDNINSHERFSSDIRNYRTEREIAFIDNYIIRLTKAFNILSGTSQLMNKCFGIPLLLIIFSSFLNATFCGYSFFIELETSKSLSAIIRNLCALIGFVIPIIAICTAAQRCVNESRMVGALLHCIDHEDENDVIKRFSLQIIQQKVEFKAAGWFNIDSSLLVSVCLLQ